MLRWSRDRVGQHGNENFSGAVHWSQFEHMQYLEKFWAREPTKKEEAQASTVPLPVAERVVVSDDEVVIVE